MSLSIHKLVELLFFFRVIKLENGLTALLIADIPATGLADGSANDGSAGCTRPRSVGREQQREVEGRGKDGVAKSAEVESTCDKERSTEVGSSREEY